MNSLFKFFLNLVPRPLLIKCSYIFAPIVSLFFRGKKFTDPIDEKNYRRFLPYGYGKIRQNVLAPGTLSLERHRLMWLYLKRKTHFFTTHLKVLHMAPEQCFLKRFKKMENLKIITADLYSPIVDVKADILDLPFQDNVFDVVFCNHVLEHIQEDALAMSELYRVMKPGGWGIFQVPMQYHRDKTYEDITITDKNERKKHFGQYDHVRWYGMDYFERLKKTGFEVYLLRCDEFLNEEEINKYVLTKNEILPLVKKPDIAC